MTITVVIPTYRRAHLLRGCVESVLAGERVPEEILMVGRQGDAETEAIVEGLRTEFAARVSLRGVWVTEPGHIPPVEAGARAALGDIVAFIDDDVTVTPPWLARLVRHFDDPAVGVVGGRVTVPGAPVPARRGRPGHFSWYGKFWGNLGSVDGDAPVDVLTVMEGNWAWRRDLLAGLHFNPVLNFDDGSMYGLDLTLQARQRSFRVLYDPAAEALHHVAPRAPELDRADRPRRIFSYCRNYTFIAHKHLSAWRRVVFRLWWLLMGERSAWAPGAATLAALRGDLSWRKEMAAARAGKREGMRLWREWVRSGGSR